jgi:hypothetical protein
MAYTFVKAIIKVPLSKLQYQGRVNNGPALLMDKTLVRYPKSKSSIAGPIPDICVASDFAICQ